MGTITSFFGMPSEMYIVYSGKLTDAPGYESNIGDLSKTPVIKLQDSKIKEGDLVYIIVSNPHRDMDLSIYGISQIYWETDDEEYPMTFLISSICIAQDGRIDIVMNELVDEDSGEEPLPDWVPQGDETLTVFIPDFKSR
jgi:hypothetical protein